MPQAVARPASAIRISSLERPRLLVMLAYIALLCGLALFFVWSRLQVVNLDYQIATLGSRFREAKLQLLACFERTAIGRPDLQGFNQQCIGNTKVLVGMIRRGLVDSIACASRQTRAFIVQTLMLDGRDEILDGCIPVLRNRCHGAPGDVHQFAFDFRFANLVARR